MQRLDVRRLRLAGFHPTGTAAAGSDPARHPVDPEGRLRGVDGVWVADGSILPSCPGVNPQVSIMAMAIGVGEAAPPLAGPPLRRLTSRTLNFRFAGVGSTFLPLTARTLKTCLPGFSFCSSSAICRA